MLRKDELIKKMAQETSLPKSHCKKALEGFCKVVRDELKNGEEIQIIGFGTFERSKRAARTGTNFTTGQSIDIPPAYVPKFKFGQSVRDYVNGK